MSEQQVETLLDTFLSIARNASTVEDCILECGEEQWTYGDLDNISTALAIELHSQCGSQPTVVAFSENHPYVLAVLLATWKLAGIFAPLDCHAPLEMVEKMLENLGPTCVLIRESDEVLKALAQTVHALLPEISPSVCLPPSSSSLALYLHTSSASSTANLKCVPLSHGTISRGSRSRIEWLRRAWPEQKFDKLRVLGWAPWSHIMGVSHDLGAATFGTGGCYVFGALPPGYPAEPATVPKEMDHVDRLLDTALRVQPDVLVGVPWMLEAIRERYLRLLDLDTDEARKQALHVKDMLAGLKCFGVGGAMPTVEALRWAKDLGVNMAHDIGMTELGGPIFHSKIDQTDAEIEGWSIDDCLIEDAELTLMDEDGHHGLSEGELVITSRFISQGYLKYDNSAFTKAPDGKITFRTGDIYERTPNERFVWKGRKEDYIQMVTSETLDPRPIEKVLNSCPSIAHSCIVGNNFMRKPSEFICAIIQPAAMSSSGPTSVSAPGVDLISPKQVAEITKAIAAVNRTLLPPLRIAWSRVLILDKEKEIPYTRKGTIFRKKLEDVFGEFLATHLSKKDGEDANGTNHGSKSDGAVVSIPEKQASEDIEAPDNLDKKWKRVDVEKLVTDTVAAILGIPVDVLNAHSDSSFAEFGMDSNMAVQVVNQLNSIFALQLPLNACHNFVDLTKLSEAILFDLGVIDRPAISPISTELHPIQTKAEVVIVGQALRLPGDINTPESFWEALINKRDDIMARVPADRWDHDSFYRPPSSTSSPQICDITFEKAGFVDVAHFDNTFFGISAPEALFVSPAVRLTLETAFEALEDACMPISKVKATSMGVFVATGLDTGYHQMLFMEKGFDAYTRFFGTGIASSTACGRLSYLLDVHGPSTTIDTACSSGLVAFDQAVKYLQSGDGESAIVSAVGTNLWPGSFGFLSAQKMASPRSRCATFTNQADGYVPSEGSVAFVLKTKSAALRDGDNILAVVKSTDVMHGGRSQGLVAPNVHTQIALQRSLVAKAGLQPSDIDFLEAHGTGTSLGDLIEIQGINEVFRGSHSGRPLIVGAAKSCVGHTELAAGLVGVLKAIASFQNSAVPGLDRNPCYGLVLANGFAGTVAGVVLEDPKNLSVMDETPRVSDTNGNAQHSAMMFVVSAKSLEGLKRYLQKYLDFCRTAPASKFREICYTSCVGREHYRHRFASVASNMEQLISALDERLRSFSAERITIPARRIVFSFPGQGSQYQGMGSILAGQYPDFADILTSAATTASQRSGYPILSFLLESWTPSTLTIDHGQVAQICIFVYQYSMSLWLKRLGVEPYGVLGHSLGEISAAVTAGAMSYELGLELVIKRAEILRSDPSRPGGMAIVEASKDLITELTHQLGLDARLVIAVYNGQQSHVISGDLDAINAFLATAKANGLRATRLKVSQGFHSPSIYPSLPSLQEWVDKSQPFFSHLKIPLYSTVYGKEIPSDCRLPSHYWVEHARDPVRFSDVIEELNSKSTTDIILDVGPQPFIWTSLQGLRHNKTAIATSSKPSNDHVVTNAVSTKTQTTHGVCKRL
ncbi:hypothetical protein BDZ97DRAFT_1920218 [Flammula alnicola]|nr:hypothetical protein BDZ97DRAFT_1920218 [Flammula alnicola]